jgi:hypothetical protein
VRHNQTDLIREAITEYWGERCSTIDADCPCCRAWMQLDALEQFFDGVASLTINHEVVRLNENVSVAVVYPKALGRKLEQVDKEWWNGD